MSRFTGPQPGYKGLHGRTKGVVRRFLEERSARIAAEQKRKTRARKAEGTEETENRETDTDISNDSSTNSDSIGNSNISSSPSLEP